MHYSFNNLRHSINVIQFDNLTYNKRCADKLDFYYYLGNGGRTVINPEAIDVTEHTPLRLDCLYKDNRAPPKTNCRWSKVTGGTTTLLVFIHDNCVFNNLFEETYNFECTNETSSSLIIRSTDRNFHETVFSCSYFVNSISATGYSTIRVIGLCMYDQLLFK